MLSVVFFNCYAECQYAECCSADVVVAEVIVVPNVLMLSVVVPVDMKPRFETFSFSKFWKKIQ
jgi:hypothetical protein